MPASHMAAPPPPYALDRGDESRVCVGCYAPRPHIVVVYCPSFECFIKVPRKFINQLPAHKMNITRLVVCTNYSRAVAETGGQFTSDPKWNLEACRMGAKCKFVHVRNPLSDFPRHSLHAHYIWRSLEDVTYERLWVGPEAESPIIRLVACEDSCMQCHQFFHQAHIERTRSHAALDVNVTKKTRVLAGDVPLHARTEPGTVVLVDVLVALLPFVSVPATRLLKTAGVTEYLTNLANYKTVVALSMCFNYFCENECRLGDKCPHAHVINLDPFLRERFARRSHRLVKEALLSVELVDRLPLLQARCVDNNNSMRPTTNSKQHNASFDTDDCLPRDLFTTPNVGNAHLSFPPNNGILGAL